MQPLACPERSRRAQAVGEDREEDQSPEGAKENFGVTKFKIPTPIVKIARRMGHPRGSYPTQRFPLGRAVQWRDVSLRSEYGAGRTE
jgi:hypothetical protein